jgi:hypothetical protein
MADRLMMNKTTPRTTPQRSRELIVAYHTILIGTSPLIPVPFLDEWIMTHVWRHMVSELAKSYGCQLSSVQVRQLAYQNQFNCSQGCAAIIIYPLKEIIGEILFWLEWRRGVNLATSAYYSGYLLNVLFAIETFDPRRASQYQEAIQTAIKGTNSKLVRKVIRGTFLSGKGAFKATFYWLWELGRLGGHTLVSGFKSFWSKIKTWPSKLSRPKKEGPVHMAVEGIATTPTIPASNTINSENGGYQPDDGEATIPPDIDQDIDDLFQDHRPELDVLLGSLADNFQAHLGQLPKDHFDQLREAFNQEIQKGGLI